MHRAAAVGAGAGTRPHRYLDARGQRLCVVLDLDLVVAITCGAYDAEAQSTVPDRVMALVLASLG